MPSKPNVPRNGRAKQAAAGGQSSRHDALYWRSTIGAAAGSAPWICTDDARGPGARPDPDAGVGSESPGKEGKAGWACVGGEARVAGVEEARARRLALRGRCEPGRVASDLTTTSSSPLVSTASGGRGRGGKEQAEEATAEGED